MKILTVEDLRKSYGPVEAVKGVSFSVEEGSLFSFLGPNGAGKSTTISMLSTALAPDGGKATICGHALGREDDKIRRSLGVVFQGSVLDPLLTVEENLTCRASLYGLDGKKAKAAARDAMEKTGLRDLAARRYGRLSGGQRRRVDIARALVISPRLLILDEPTTGLDPQTRQNIWELIEGLRKDTGMTVFLTTHYMEEAARSQNVVILDGGRIAAEGTPAELKERYAKDILTLFPLPGREGELSNRLAALGCGGPRIPLDRSLQSLPILAGTRDLLESYTMVQGTMDDVFLAITGKELRQ